MKSLVNKSITCGIFLSAFVLGFSHRYLDNLQERNKKEYSEILEERVRASFNLAVTRYELKSLEKNLRDTEKLKFTEMKKLLEKEFSDQIYEKNIEREINSFVLEEVESTSQYLDYKEKEKRYSTIDKILGKTITVPTFASFFSGMVLSVYRKRYGT